MKITQETFSVLPDAAGQEINIVMAGLRLAFTAGEARRLADGLDKALAQLHGAGDEPAAPALSAMVGGARAEEPATVSLMITQAQRSALRQKGHSDEAIRNMKPAEAHRLLGLAEKAS